MKIRVIFLPSEYTADYKYASYGQGGKLLIKGVQFEPSNTSEEL